MPHPNRKDQVRDEFSTQPRPREGYAERRTEVFVLVFLGYAACYLVRNNTAIMSEILVREEGWTPVEVGLVLTAFTLTYGVGKLVMGVLVDRASLRLVFGSALVASAAICIAMGWFGTIPLLAVAMGLIGLIQGACAPAALSTLGAWYAPWQRGSRVAVWNTSQNLGAAVLPLIISGSLFVFGVNRWAVGYWIPGALALAVGVWVLVRGADRPWREGFPTLTELYGREALPEVPGSSEASYWRLVRVHVIGNRLLLVLAVLNALLYLVRFGILNWMPLYLIADRGSTLHEAALVMAVFEWSAIPGALVFAALAARWPNRMAVAGAVGVLVLGGAILVYGSVGSVADVWGVVAVMGALTYGPQVVINILTLNFVSPRAMGVAVGFVGLGGYLVGQVLANIGMPVVAGAQGWSTAFGLLAASCVVAALLYWSLRRAELRVVPSR